MKILTGAQIREADRVTIAREPIPSIDLMERASESLAQWIANHIDSHTPLVFLIGRGNNGGDGLAVARILHYAGFSCSVYTLADPESMSDDCRFNYERLPEEIDCQPINGLTVPDDAVLIDAILGTGIHGPVRAVEASVIDAINQLSNRVISIDIPSGMLTEFGNADRPIVHADHTLTIEYPKLAMLLPEAGECCGTIEIIPIDLDPDFMSAAATPYRYLTADWVSGICRPRAKFAHKNTYGHALLVAGSDGMMGAALLTVGAALRSGCGLVTAHIPSSERTSMYATNPSAMLSLDPGDCFTEQPTDIDRYAAIGIGPGLGQSVTTQQAVSELLQHVSVPCVVDADALNILASHPSWQSYIPAGSILTPHIGELRRLVGPWEGEQQKIERALALAQTRSSVVIVKGAHTMLCMPGGEVYFNSTGTPGMAKGGCGDVLTGLLTGLLARGYSAPEAAVLGVYLHGRAGEKAAEYYHVESMNSGDMADFIPEAYSELMPTASV